MRKDSSLNTLQIALNQLERAGIHVRIAPLYGATEHSVVIVLPGVILEDGNLREEKTE